MTKVHAMQLNTARGYFQNQGVNVMAFDDIYPEGHQSGVSILMHGRRIATCGDVRLEPTPGQWQPVPRQLSRNVDEKANAIVTELAYPDETRHLQGLNPMIYPDLEMKYRVTVAGEGDAVLVTVDLDAPLPEAYQGKVCLNLELFPGLLFGKPWIMDEQSGIFPRQPNGPVAGQESLRLRGRRQREASAEGLCADWKRLTGEAGTYNPIIADEWIASPYAEGRSLTVCPDDPQMRLHIACLTEGASLRLYDGRMNHNNGWFVVSSFLPAGRSEKAMCWRITPHAVPGWQAPTVVQVSQVGYGSAWSKRAVLETDPERKMPETAQLYRLTPEGEVCAATFPVVPWGNFLRYRYGHVDFTEVREAGLYRLKCEGAESTLFRIGDDVLDRGVWQPVLEYFLPVQMCHMRVQEKYRVWHGCCHRDDARMAPTNLNHFDNYRQGASTLSCYQPGDMVPGLNVGGWHDAGDYDLRVESQSGEVYVLALAREAFGVDYDATSVDQEKHVVEIHQPDGKPDILQQIEHGLLSIVGGWKTLGRLYRGIICPTLRQYVLLGDAVNMTDGNAGNEDDRWVFTEENPSRELTTAAHLAAGARVMKGFNDTLGAEAMAAAEMLFAQTMVSQDDEKARNAKILAAAELFLATGKDAYRRFLIEEAAYMAEHAAQIGWIAARVVDRLQDVAFEKTIRGALPALQALLQAQCAETPYGIPYRPHIWGAGWGIQAMAFRYYFLHRAFPEMFDGTLLENAMHFVLGCHPGSHAVSFASGVGTHSATVAYGMNRADWSYIPGGVISGTALIRPDFPELLEYPFLWQQTEYVLGGGSSNYMFLVLAVQEIRR